MFNSWSLRAKLIGAFGVCATILAVVGVVAYVRLGDVVTNYNRVVKINMPKLAAVADFNDSARRLNILVSRLTGAGVVSASDLQKHEKYLAEAVADMESAKKSFLSLPFGTGEEALWQSVDENVGMVLEYGRKTIEMSRDPDPEAVKRRDVFAGDYDSVRAPFRNAVNKLKEYQDKEASRWASEAERGSNSASIIVMVLVFAGVLLSVMLGFFISASLSRTMSRVSEQLSAGADEVTSAASEISSTSEQLSSSASEQASSLQETASSIEEMSSMIKQNSDNASRSSETARSGQESADKGKQVIGEMLEAMSSIDASNKEIGEVVKVIGQIGNKTKVIDDIVFKTQLLSFNASVEAARAGEHGKGFAVVAEEVGNLAQMSGNAAREISDMLEQSLERVERMISSAKQKVEIGIQVGKKCGEVLDEIVVSVGDVNSMAGEIANACQEQSRGINEITRAMSQLDQVTQQNASASQQSASAAEQLSQQAESLRASVRELMLLINGSAQVSAYQAPVSIHRGKKNGSAKKEGQFAGKPQKSIKKGSHDNVPSAQHEGFDDAA